jgi:5-methylthioribose kinase
MLAQPEVVPYLLRRGFISAESIVNGDLQVVDASRRNRNFKVISNRGPCYLVKQGVGRDGSATVAHESNVYQSLAAMSQSMSFQSYIPRYYGYDEHEHILVLELVDHAQDLREYHTHGYFSTRIATTLGLALSTLHRLGSLAIARHQITGFVGRIPWVLLLHRPSFNVFRNTSNANVQLIRIIQNASEFPRILDELREGWRVDSLIHHDIRWDNCLTFDPFDSRCKSGLKIIDWEFADLGDSCWDIGSVFSSYLSFWLFSIPVAGEEPPNGFLELARYPLERMQPAIRAYWKAYVRGMRLDAIQSEDWLLRAVKYGAARLVQIGFEHMQHSTHLTGNLICLLQLGLNIMRRPEEAIKHLLGIPLTFRGE